MHRQMQSHGFEAQVQKSSEKSPQRFSGKKRHCLSMPRIEENAADMEIDQGSLKTCTT
jgi:hypothetical protein